MIKRFNNFEDLETFTKNYFYKFESEDYELYKIIFERFIEYFDNNKSKYEELSHLSKSEIKLYFLNLQDRNGNTILWFWSSSNDKIGLSVYMTF